MQHDRAADTYNVFRWKLSGGRTMPVHPRRRKENVMRYVLSVLLLPALVPAALAQENEAEKLFHAMEKKIKAANAVQVAVDIELSALKGQEKNFSLKGDPGKFKGFLLFTKDNKAWLKITRDFVGMEMVSN